MRKVIFTFLLSLIPAKFALALPTAFNVNLVPSCAPNCSWEDFVTFANSVLEFMVFFATLIAGTLVLYAAYKYITAGGSPEKIKEGHQVFKHAIIGLLIVLFAWLSVDVLVKALTGRGINDWSSPDILQSF